MIDILTTERERAASVSLDLTEVPVHKSPSSTVYTIPIQTSILGTIVKGQSPPCTVLYTVYTVSLMPNEKETHGHATYTKKNRCWRPPAASFTRRRKSNEARCRLQVKPGCLTGVRTIKEVRPPPPPHREPYPTSLQAFSPPHLRSDALHSERSLL